jgi:sialic acid synthase SpsE
MRIIAEAGENHVGDMQRAVAMVRIAAKSGADFIKFQSYSVDDLSGGVEAEVRDWIQRVQLSVDDHYALHEEAKQAGITFLSTAVNVHWANLLREMGCSAVKLASLSLTNERLLHYVSGHFDEVFISTGMGDTNEVAKARSPGSQSSTASRSTRYRTLMHRSGASHTSKSDSACRPGIPTTPSGPRRASRQRPWEPN